MFNKLWVKNLVVPSALKISDSRTADYVEIDRDIKKKMQSTLANGIED